MSAITRTLEAGVVTLTIDQPDQKVNILSTSLWKELGSHLEEVGKLECRGVIIQSGKSGNFLAGADLKELSGEPSATDVRNFIDRGHRVLFQLEELSCPTVACIDGAALGGGFELAMACDYRLIGSSPKWKLGMPELNLGVIPGWGGTQRLPRYVGIEEAIMRLISGESYDPQDLPPEDFISDYVESGDFQSAIEACLQRTDWQQRRAAKQAPLSKEELPDLDDMLENLQESLAELDQQIIPVALSLISLVVTGCLSSLREGIANETELFVELATQPLAQQRIAAFLNRKK
ncbi:MAG: enoyl-CoA hydratase/isomerase family protein [Zavarzinella sp.]